MSLRRILAEAQECHIESQRILAGGPGSGRHKEMMGHIKNAMKLSNKLGESRLSSFLSKLHDHVKSGQDPTPAHDQALGKHTDRMDDKASNLYDRLDYNYSDKADKLATQYSDLRDHLEAIGPER